MCHSREFGRFVWLDCRYMGNRTLRIVCPTRMRTQMALSAATSGEEGLVIRDRTATYPQKTGQIPTRDKWEMSLRESLDRTLTPDLPDQHMRIGPY